MLHVAIERSNKQRLHKSGHIGVRKQNNALIPNMPNTSSLFQCTLSIVLIRRNKQYDCHCPGFLVIFLSTSSLQVDESFEHQPRRRETPSLTTFVVNFVTLRHLLILTLVGQMDNRVRKDGCMYAIIKNGINRGRHSLWLGEIIRRDKER